MWQAMADAALPGSGPGSHDGARALVVNLDQGMAADRPVQVAGLARHVDLPDGAHAPRGTDDHVLTGHLEHVVHELLADVERRITHCPRRFLCAGVVRVPPYEGAGDRIPRVHDQIEGAVL